MVKNNLLKQNGKEAYAPEEMKDRTICIQADINPDPVRKNKKS